MIRKYLICLNAFLFLILASGGCKAQSAPALGALSPEVLHRIQNEIRSRYSVPPQVVISVSAPEASDVPGYDKLIVTFAHDEKKTTFDFLVSKDRKMLARLEKIDISQDLMSKIDVQGRPVRGNSEARVTIVNYDDFECPFCSRMHQTFFPGLLEAYGDKIRFIYKDYPLLEIHPWAMHAAIDANCLGEQNGSAYWDFADYVHSNQKTISGHSEDEAFANLDHAAAEQAASHKLDLPRVQACVKKQDQTAVRASMAEGDKLGVDSTPTFFVNGERITGLMPPEQMHKILDRALADAGVTPPTLLARPADEKR